MFCSFWKNLFWCWISIIGYFGIILQAVQQNNFITSNSEKQIVKDKLKKLFGNYKFSGPQNITLEMKHLSKRQYVDYSKVLSIRRNYSVTEKADGERNIAVILDDGGVYFINSQSFKSIDLLPFQEAKLSIGLRIQPLVVLFKDETGNVLQRKGKFQLVN